MMARPGLLAAGTLVWGWFCDVMIVAVPVALLVESWRWTSARWDLSAKDFQRVADFCTWLFVLETGYFIVAQGWPLPILRILQWLPLVLAPLLIAQLYSSTGRIQLSALFLSLRADGAGELASRRVDLSFAYVGICALAAGAANFRTPWYFAAVVLLALWSLCGVRSRRFSLGLWAGLAALAAVAGYVGQHGLNQLQVWVFNVAIEYFQLDLARTDPYRSSTDIGHIGELKSSDRIVMRVVVPRDTTMPLLLRRASYDVYAAATWIAKDAAFSPMTVDDASGHWIINAATPAERSVSVRETLTIGSGVLALPDAPVALAGFGSATLSRNRLGTIRVERSPGLVSYTVSSAANAKADDRPGANDVRLPAQESRTLTRAAADLALSSLKHEQIPPRLKDYFAEHFRYATFRAERVDIPHAISEFLLRSRAGHCEYFATATVLLARAAGIPARYATGFAVQEYSDLERSYIVRERHAHAWAQLYLNGAWRDVDTTPPQWFAAEAGAASFWEPVSDLASWLAFRYAAWRAQEGGTSSWWYVLVTVLLLILIWRLYRGGGFSRVGRTGKAIERLDRAAGFDTAFYGVERQLARLGLPRHDRETHGEWLHRIAPCFDPCDRQVLYDLLRLHNRSRFDPKPMSEPERLAFARAASGWVASAPRSLRSAAEAVMTGAHTYRAFDN